MDKNKVRLTYYKSNQSNERLPDIKVLGNGEYLGAIWGHTFLYRDHLYYVTSGPKSSYPIYCILQIDGDSVMIKFMDKYQRKSLVQQFDKNTKAFATYGGGPHHVVIAHRDNSGKWRAEVIEEEFQAAKEAFENTDPKKETYKVYKLD